MKRLTILLVAMLAAGSLLADTLELADGRILEGDFVGSSNGIIMFNTGKASRHSRKTRSWDCSSLPG